MSEEKSVVKTSPEQETVVAAERRWNEYVVPEVDIYEKDDEIVLLANVPGADDKSTEVVLDKNVLTITAEVERKAPEGFRAYYAENAAAGYRRQFTLSEDLDRNGINASVTNGVLKITLKKAEEAKPRKIDITSG